jgi:hypothetical protein
MALLQRFAYLESGTLGKLSIGDWSSYTIERPWKDNQPNVSCIPEGTYACQPFSGTRFQDVIQLMDVPGRSYILIHVANFPHDVEGCIGVGDRFVSDALEPAVYNSKKTLAKLMEIFNGHEERMTLKVTGIRAEI